MRMLVFNWHNSDVEESSNNVEPERKRKVQSKKSKIFSVVKNLEELGNKNGLKLPEKVDDVEGLVGWKIETKEYSSKCFDLAMEKNEIEKFKKIKAKDFKLTQMHMMFKEMKKNVAADGGDKI